MSLNQKTEQNHLIILGDVFLPRSYKVNADLSDFFVFNLEGPITKKKEGYSGKIILKAENDFIGETFGTLPTAVSLANNHIMDYGEEGLKDTLSALNARGIKYFGAGYLSENCNNPLIFEVNGKKIAFMGYVCETSSGVFAKNNSAGVMPIDLKIIQKDINAAKNQGADFITVMLHWGAEEVFLPKSGDIETARKIIDAGVDLIIGSHAHRVQAYEIYKGKHIFYGAGNFITPDIEGRIIYPSGEEKEFIKKQMFWNRYSLAADISLRDKSVKIRRFYFNKKKGVLTESPADIKKYAFKLGSAACYQKKFRISYIYGKLRRIAADFIVNPRIPTVQNLKNVFNFLSKGNK